MKINGVQREYSGGLTISQMLKEEGFQKERVAVERNEEIIPKEAYDTTKLQDADVVEVVSFMGGGSR